MILFRAELLLLLLLEAAFPPFAAAAALAAAADAAEEVDPMAGERVESVPLTTLLELLGAIWPTLPYGAIRSL